MKIYHAGRYNTVFTHEEGHRRCYNFKDAGIPSEALAYAEDNDLWNDEIKQQYELDNPAPTAEEIIEQQRRSAKAARDSSLNSLIYTFQDGRELQTRPIDAQNIQTAIALNEDIEFVCADNSIHLFTVPELQEAMTAGINAAKTIWSLYINAIR